MLSKKSKLLLNLPVSCETIEAKTLYMYLGVLNYAIHGVLIREEDQYQTSPHIYTPT